MWVFVYSVYGVSWAYVQSLGRVAEEHQAWATPGAQRAGGGRWQSCWRAAQYFVGLWGRLGCVVHTLLSEGATEVHLKKYRGKKPHCLVCPVLGHSSPHTPSSDVKVSCGVSFLRRTRNTLDKDENVYCQCTHCCFCHQDAEGPEQGFPARPWSWVQGDVTVPWWRSFLESLLQISRQAACSRAARRK